MVASRNRETFSYRLNWNEFRDWAALGDVLPAGSGRWSFPSLPRWWGHISNAGLSSGLPSVRDVDIVKQVQHRTSNMIRELVHFSGRRKMGLQPGEEKAQGELINVKEYLMGGTEEKEHWLFHGALWQAERQQAQARTRFLLSCLNSKKHFSTTRESKHWYRLPR